MNDRDWYAAYFQRKRELKEEKVKELLDEGHANLKKLLDWHRSSIERISGRRP